MEMVRKGVNHEPMTLAGSSRPPARRCLRSLAGDDPHTHTHRPTAAVFAGDPSDLRSPCSLLVPPPSSKPWRKP